MKILIAGIVMHIYTFIQPSLPYGKILIEAAEVNHYYWSLPF
jgi:hypothetical protein